MNHLTLGHNLLLEIICTYGILRIYIRRKVLSLNLSPILCVNVSATLYVPEKGRKTPGEFQNKNLLFWSTRHGSPLKDVRDFRCVRKIWKRLLVSSFKSIRLSAWENSAATGRIFTKFDNWIFARNYRENPRFLKIGQE